MPKVRQNERKRAKKGKYKSSDKCSKEMALVNKTLTDGERAAIYYGVFLNVDNWTELYAIADGIKDREKIHRSTVYQWKNTPKIQALLQEAQMAKLAFVQECERAGYEKGRKEAGKSVHTQNDGNLNNSKFVDYSDPKAQTRKLNELVNSADDPGEALDALKVIISTQKADREAAKERKTVQYYRPIRCNQCPLYQNKAQKAKK